MRDPSKRAPGIEGHLFGVEHGDAKQAAEIKATAIRNQCDAIVNAAELAAMVPWGKGDLLVIVDAVISAALEIGQGRGNLFRL